MSLLGDVLDNRDGRLEEVFTETLHKRGAAGTSQGGKFISSGSSGQGVRTVQRKTGATVDGAFGYNTRASVEAYQRKHGLTVDGVVGHQTAAALRGQKNASKVHVGALTTADRHALGSHTGGTHKASSKSKSTKTKTPAKPPKPYKTARGRASYTSRSAGGMVA